ncbi:low affinity immunoglobulin gamma Fc region receptor III-A-like [Clarias gariepinus]
MMEFSLLSVMLLLISLKPVIHAQGSNKAVLTIEPDPHLYSGETVTFRCDIKGEGDTEWTYRFYKYNKSFYTGRKVYSLISARKSFGGKYTCRGQKNDSQSSEISDPVTLTVSERTQAVLNVAPQSWLTERDSVTLNCEVTDSSTNWTFSWYRQVPGRNFVYYLRKLSDSNRGSGGSYTLSPAALNHTGVYVCRGERGERPFYTKYSNLQPIWIIGESPPDSLIINPNRTQHFTGDSLLLSCEDQNISTGWTVIRYTDKKGVKDCLRLGSVTGSTCKISSLSTSHTGIYWCESESGASSNPVNITVHEAPSSVLMLISSVVTASPYLLVTIILLIKYYRARGGSTLIEHAGTCPVIG